MPEEKLVQKLSVEDRQNMESEIREGEEIVNNVDGLEIGRNLQKKAEMKAAIEKKKAALARDEDLVARGAEKDRIYAEIKTLEDRVKPDMPTHNEMWAKLGTDASLRAVEKNRAFHRKHGQTLVRLQNLKKRLEPDDPMAGDLERIRPS